jgi:methionine-rich copper-binding protein CopC
MRARTTTLIRLAAFTLAVGTLGAAAPTAGADSALAPDATAARHAHLVKSEPTANDTLAAAPKALKLWFSEKVELGVTTLKLTDAAGTALPLGKPWSEAADEAPVVAAISAALAPGSYKVAWKAAAKDGHPASGMIAFVVKGTR